VLDVTDQFVAARRRGPWPIEQVVAAVADGSAFPDLRAEWDPDSGEQWVRLFKTSTLLGLLWAPGPLVIETKNHREVATEVTRVTGTYCEIIVVPHMNTPILSFASHRLAQVWPDGDWPTGAVDPAAMSAYDLWYATS
jgi:hypothetical protein